MIHRITRATTAAAIAALFMTACTSGKEDPVPPPEDGGGDLVPPLNALPAGLDAFDLKIPADNPLKGAEGLAKVELGKHLYFDKRLSSDNSVACATCHDPAKGWTDNLPVSVGVGGKKGGRSAPTIINRVFSEAQFWDGRAPSLEAQAVGPIANPIEMNLPHAEAVKKISDIAGYKPLFKAAFKDETVTIERIGKAIASFERTIVSGNSPFDKFEAGDKTALSESAQRGRELFRDPVKGRCSICHAGANFTDEKFHNLGVGADQPDWQKNHAGQMDHTKKPEDLGKYKTPTLRNIADTAPYMHDGSEATLEAAVEFYVKGGIKNPNLDPEMKPLELTDQEKADLVEYLKALSGEVTKVTPPTPVN